MASDYNFVYVNSNGDVWVTPGEPGTDPEPSITRIDGVTAEQVEQLRNHDWKVRNLIDTDPAWGNLPTRDLG